MDLFNIVDHDSYFTPVHQGDFNYNIYHVNHVYQIDNDDSIQHFELVLLVNFVDLVDLMDHEKNGDHVNLT